MEMNRVYKFNQDKKELRKARSRVSDWHRDVQKPGPKKIKTPTISAKRMKEIGVSVYKNGEFIDTWPSIGIASRHVPLSKMDISRMLKGYKFQPGHPKAEYSVSRAQDLNDIKDLDDATSRLPMS